MRTALSGSLVALASAWASPLPLPEASGCPVQTVPSFPRPSGTPKLGYNGLDNLDITAQGVTAIALYITGIALMVTANAGAWKETNGY